MNSVVEFKNVSKDFVTSKGKYGLLIEAISNFFSKTSKNKNKIHALKNVSFSLKPGEAIGIIGKNGAGKSTILKLISKIIYPNSGEIIVNGKIGAFIELGAGLHPELSGRENIYLYGAILGMKKSEIEKKFNEIVEFAELKKFLEIPIKKYSSGMYSRLGFSVCSFCNPDILLVDEVLAVGDIQFQKKCLDKMHSFAKEKTVVFVSHNLDAVAKICKKVMLIENGKIVKFGNAIDVIRTYVRNSKTI